MTAVIYTLGCPIEDRVMYVGKTADPNGRLINHLSSAKSGKTAKDKWIFELLNLGLKPLFAIVEECQKGKSKEREQYWIAHYRSINPDLFNISNKGNNLDEAMIDAVRLRFTDADRTIIDELKAVYHIKTDSEIIRRALYYVARKKPVLSESIRPQRMPTIAEK